MKKLENYQKTLCRKVMPLLLALVMVTVGMLGTGMTANASGLNISISSPKYYTTGTLKQLTAKFDWFTAGATGRLVLMKEYLNGTESILGDLTDFGNYGNAFANFDQVLAYDTAPGTEGTFGIISYSEEKNYSMGSTDNTFTFDFGESEIPLNKNCRYYVYLWTKYHRNYYPDNLFVVINVADGVVQYTPATGRNSFDDSAFNAVVDETETAYKVTVTPAANMTRKTESGALEQPNLKGPMTSVVYTANSGYYFPENYAVTGVNGINVSRDSDAQITVYGKPTADTTIALTAPAERQTPPAPTTYQITVASTENGTTGVSTSTAAAGDPVTIQTNPNEGYGVESVKYHGSDNVDHEVALTDGAYVFVMPASDVTVTVTYQHVHAKGTHHEKIEPTCVTAGKREYWDCTGTCGKKLDKDGNVINLMTEEELQLPSLGHALGTKHDAVAATCSKKGTVEYYDCANGCGSKLDGNKNVLKNIETEFKCELIDTSYVDTTGKTEQKENVNTQTVAVKTGDNSPVAVWSTVLGMAVAAMVTVDTWNQKKRSLKK